ncbi:hypothetical protein ACJX0J_037064 [Zea mays]
MRVICFLLSFSAFLLNAKEDPAATDPCAYKALTSQWLEDFIALFVNKKSKKINFRLHAPGICKLLPCFRGGLIFVFLFFLKNTVVVLVLPSFFFIMFLPLVFFFSFHVPTIFFLLANYSHRSYFHENFILSKFISAAIAAAITSEQLFNGSHIVFHRHNIEAHMIITLNNTSIKEVPFILNKRYAFKIEIILFTFLEISFLK